MSATMPPVPPQMPQQRQAYSPFIPPSGTLFQAVRGPIMMIVIGILLTIDSMGGFSINHTWPVMLIIYGILRLVDRMDGTPVVGNS